MSTGDDVMCERKKEKNGTVHTKIKEFEGTGRYGRVLKYGRDLRYGRGFLKKNGRITTRVSEKIK